MHYRYVSDKDARDLTIITALYGEDGALLEIKLAPHGAAAAGTAIDGETAEFTGDFAAGRTIKLFAWDEVNESMRPLFPEADRYEITE